MIIKLKQQENLEEKQKEEKNTNRKNKFNKKIIIYITIFLMIIYVFYTIYSPFLFTMAVNGLFAVYSLKAVFSSIEVSCLTSVRK